MLKTAIKLYKNIEIMQLGHWLHKSLIKRYKAIARALLLNNYRKKHNDSFASLKKITNFVSNNIQQTIEN